MSAPTPATTSIMKTDSGSIITSRPERYEPPATHVQAVDTSWRWLPSRPSSPMNDASAPPNATKHDRVATYPDARRDSRVPPRVISPAETSGESRQIQAPET